MTRKLKISFIIVALMLSLLTSCTGTLQYKADSNLGKAVYYARYITGVKDYLPWLSAAFPNQSALITGVLMPLLTMADTALADYQAGSIPPETVQTMIEGINHVVGTIKGTT